MTSAWALPRPRSPRPRARAAPARGMLCVYCTAHAQSRSRTLLVRACPCAAVCYRAQPLVLLLGDVTCRLDLRSVVCGYA